MLKILYVDGNELQREAFANELSNENCEVNTTSDPIVGLELISKNDYDIIVSEIDLKTIDGMRFLDSVYNINPLIKRVIYTDNEDPELEISALSKGIDIYLLKSRGTQLAVKSIRTLKSTITKEVADQTHLYSRGCDLCMNLLNHDVTIRGENVALSPKEFELLRLLLENKGLVLNREDILNKLWYESDNRSARVVDTHIKKLREKTNCFEIKTIRGYGYLWNENGL